MLLAARRFSSTLVSLVQYTALDTNNEQRTTNNAKGRCDHQAYMLFYSHIKHDKLYIYISHAFDGELEYSADKAESAMRWNLRRS